MNMQQQLLRAAALHLAVDGLVSSLGKKPFFGPISVCLSNGLLFDAIFFYDTQSSFIILVGI